MTDPAPPTRLEVRGICKRFPGVRALHEVQLTVGAGEVLAVIGENGAGKSTLVKILAGVLAPDAGAIRLDGEPVALSGVADALHRGIALIHQELNLAENLDVATNVYLGREPARYGLVDRRRLHAGARALLDEIGLEVATTTVVADLSIGQRQMVEIAKALSCKARVLIMDEPTSSLTQRETEQLFRVVRSLRDRGVSVIYISHRLSEVSALADRVTVLRDGLNAGELGRDEATHDRMVRLMVGRDIARFYDHHAHPTGPPVLEARDVVVAGGPDHPISLQVREGEIVGMAGLVGAGRTELLETLFGVRRTASGTVRVGGRPLALRSPRQAIRHGLALVPEDRRLQGLIIEMAVRENISLTTIGRDARRGIIDRTRADELCREMTSRLAIRTPSPRQLVEYLSGGNQQKVVLGKWLALRPRVLLLDEPTRGIDVSAKEEIYRLMERLASERVGILFASSDLEEVLGMSDRALVMHEGRLAGELTRAQLSAEAVMGLATGGARMEAVA